MAVPAAHALEVTGLRATGDARGAEVRVELSRAARVEVHDVAGPSGTLARLYVDLPPGTVLREGVPRAADGGGPVSGLRVGRGDGGTVRVAIEVAGAAAYQVHRSDDGRVLRVLVAPATVAAAGPEPPAARRDGDGSSHGPARPRTAPEPRPRVKIVIDPGHGGHDPGAEGFAVEKDVTLAIARRLATLLRERVGADAILTRDDDATLTLADRTARANAEGADLFVSIHANASAGRRLHGIETYYLNNSADHATMRLAAMENGLDLLKPMAGKQADIRYILSDLVQVGKIDESAALATAVQRAVVRRVRERWRGVTDLGVKRGPFYVLVGAYMPCVLVETSFLTHAVEGRRLARRDYQADVADGLATGIARYLADARRARTL